jgi:hypothetical protein
MPATDKSEHTFILQVSTSTREMPANWEVERSLDLFMNKYNILAYQVTRTQEIDKPDRVINVFITLPPGNRRFKPVEKVEFPRLARTTHAA